MKIKKKTILLIANLNFLFSMNILMQRIARLGERICDVILPWNIFL